MTTAKQAKLSFRRSWPALFLTIVAVSAVGVLFWASPLGQRLETHFGLELAFHLRAQRPAPAEAVYVAISPASAHALGQASIYDLDDWDRALFAELVDRLARAGVSVIAFDILFARADGERDRAFADAIRRAGNVVLLSWVGQSRQFGDAGNDVLLRIDSLEEPAAMFEQAARAVAPMLLHKGIRMDRFATFPSVAGRRMPSIPTVALFLHRHAQFDDVRARCPRLFDPPPTTAAADPRPDLIEQILDLRSAVVEVPAQDTGAQGCPDGVGDTFHRLLAAGNERYFNFYGPPGTLAGPAFHELFGPGADGLARTLNGKVVFVGIADNTAVNPPDSFEVALGGNGISGLELAATAFANLLHDDDLKPVDPLHGALLLLVYGTALGLVFFLLPRRQALLAVVGCAALYAAAAWYLFGRHELWLPVIVPLFVQTPLTVATGWRLKLLEFERLTSNLMRFLSRWLKEKVSRHEVISDEPELRYGVCLHSDVAGYTSLSERLGANPLRLKSLERDYWRLVDEQISAHQGERLEIAGDGMTCIWTAPTPRKDIAALACRAALEIQRAIDRFNAEHADTPFRTRIGLHAGNVALGIIGGEGQYQLAVGGDVANTAARLESDINKLLRTNVLISDAVRADLDAEKTRKVGTFVPRGKTRTIAVYEIRDDERQPPVDVNAFEAALADFESGDWDAARAGFESLGQASPEDGPTAFYLTLLDFYAADRGRPPAGHPPGVVDLNAPWLVAAASG